MSKKLLLALFDVSAEFPAILKLQEHCRKSTLKTPNKNAPYIHSEATGHETDYNGILIIDRVFKKLLISFAFPFRVKTTYTVKVELILIDILF